MNIVIKHQIFEELFWRNFYSLLKDCFYISEPDMNITCCNMGYLYCLRLIKLTISTHFVNKGFYFSDEYCFEKLIKYGLFRMGMDYGDHYVFKENKYVFVDMY